ncbi:hypothetical protein [Serratia plymuthica]|uniref:hypothetical protein n=1 Tax=Serratia plymuthica TaxID=82996 RepID=UPI0018D84368|nr:hypothetical protein [Serratia plymuthica]QPS55634.1 hypothetical protein I6G53_23965 [Serratia plymuthica]CAI1676680.1 Uncharacterised protein [Serratia plymuthica]
MKYFLIGALLLAANGSAFAVELSKFDRVEHKENIICFPNGECLDIDDPGNHP